MVNRVFTSCRHARLRDAAAQAGCLAPSKGPVMGRLRLLLIAAGVLTGTAASAADMPGSWAPPALPLPSITTVRPASAWYVRGDVAYGWNRMDGAVAAPGFPIPSQNDVGKGISGGAGFGYKGEWLRTDVTLDYTHMNYSGTIATPGDVTAKVTALTGLFNGYFDLGTWYGLTPYVGAGAGVSRLRTSDFMSTLTPPFTPGLSNTQWKFAWALMAGAAVNVTQAVAVDLGYRYFDLGDVHTANDASGAMTLKNLAAHEVRVGVRWSFNDFPLPH
jgi:opacity protein-like surface antigen